VSTLCSFNCSEQFQDCQKLAWWHCQQIIQSELEAVGDISLVFFLVLCRLKFHTQNEHRIFYLKFIFCWCKTVISNNQYSLKKIFHLKHMQISHYRYFCSIVSSFYSCYLLKCFCMHSITAILNILTDKLVKKHIGFFAYFLGQLSTMCPRWAFVMTHCPSSIVSASVRACIRPSTISLNNFSSDTTYWILTKLHRNDPLAVLYQNCSNRSSWLNK